MANADSVKAKIQGLIDKANGVTAGADTNLTDAMEALAAGYGQGTAPILTDITITENGEYTPDEGVDGFGKVTVEVESGGGDDTMFISVLEGTAVDLVVPDGLVDFNIQISKNTNLKSVTFPDTLETIAGAAFAYLDKLNAPIVFPASLKSIGNNAFNSCYRIPSVTFRGKPDSIHAGAFNGAVNGGVINCPWAEGEVANAPWSATNATINYNYTGG